MPMYDQQMLMIIHALEIFRQYLVLSSHCTVRKNHESLKYLLEQKDLTPTQQKWISKIQVDDLSIYYKGNNNTIFGALSNLSGLKYKEF